MNKIEKAFLWVAYLVVLGLKCLKKCLTRKRKEKK